VMSEGKFGTMQRLACRWFGEARKNPHSAPAILGLLEKDAAAPQGKAVMLCAKFEGCPRFFSGQNPWFGCAAENFHRTDFTLGPRTADERAQFHERGIMLAGIAVREKLRRCGPELLAPGTRIDRCLQIDEAGEDAGDVRFDDRDRLFEGERGNGIRGISANSGELLNRGQVFRENAGVLFRYGNRCRPQISGAGVVAEALPGVQDVIFGSSGERGEIGEAAKPLFIIGDDGGDLGLLEHELGDEDRVRIGSAAPGKIAGVLAIPGEKRAPE
jgi:hypothetical protein